MNSKTRLGKSCKYMVWATNWKSLDGQKLKTQADTTNWGAVSGRPSSHGAAAEGDSICGLRLYFQILPAMLFQLWAQTIYLQFLSSHVNVFSGFAFVPGSLTVSVLETVGIARIGVYKSFGRLKNDARRKNLSFKSTKTSRSLSVRPLVNRTMNTVLNIWTWTDNKNNKERERKRCVYMYICIYV